MIKNKLYRDNLQKLMLEYQDTLDSVSPDEYWGTEAEIWEYFSGEFLKWMAN